MWDIPPTRDRTCISYTGRWILCHWATRYSLGFVFLHNTWHSWYILCQLRYLFPHPENMRSMKAAPLQTVPPNSHAFVAIFPSLTNASFAAGGILGLQSSSPTSSIAQSEHFIFFYCYCSARVTESSFSDQGSNPGSLHWKHRVQTTGPTGNCLFLLF